jgi:trehalose 6-phosphate phosphatase
MVRERKILRTAKYLLKPVLSQAPGIWLEDKGLGLAVHCRGADSAAIQLARLIVQMVLRVFEPDLCLLKGKKIWELLPSRIQGKGPAVRTLFSQFPHAALPIFVGDDITDESAFAALRDGITVHVGNSSRTQARFWLRNPDEVVGFLERLEAEVT